jgi:hypothetical protein
MIDLDAMETRARSAFADCAQDDGSKQDFADFLEVIALARAAADSLPKIGAPAGAAPAAPATELTDEQIDAAWELMPGKYMIDFGFRQFARKIESMVLAGAPVAEAAPTIPAELLKIGELLRTQDNRITDAPMFVIEEKTPIVSDSDYNDCRIEWRESENGDYQLASPERAARLEALHQAGRDTEGWRRYEMTDVWQFVTACFTEQGCKDYLARNAHNLRETRVYAYGSFRNSEFRAVRNWLMSLRATPQNKE